MLTAPHECHDSRSTPRPLQLGAFAVAVTLLIGCNRPPSPNTEPEPNAGEARAAARSPASTGQPSDSQPRKPVLIVPWIEVNEDKPELLASAIEGLKIWRSQTDTAIVSTTPGRARIYTELKRALPGMKIIPGVKTAGPLRPFDSLTGWSEVGREVRKMCAAAGENRCVLEHETALCNEEKGRPNYWDGDDVIDWSRFKECLKQLPPEVEIWWYPSFVTGRKKAARHGFSEKMCATVQEICKVRFVEYELSKPPNRNNWWDPELTAIMNRVAKEPPIPIIYAWLVDGRWAYWRDDEIPEALALVKGDIAIIYPGATRWVEAARTVTRRLEEVKYQPASQPAGQPVEGER